MLSALLKRVLARIGSPGLIETLGRLTGSERTSVLLEVFREQTNKISPPELLRLYQLNRLVKPADLPVIEMQRMQLDVLEHFAQHGFSPLDLSPVSQLGACSVVAPVDQHKVLSALRGTEVLADATNAIALHYCDLKKRNALPEGGHGQYRFSAIQRHMRTQAISGKGFTPHFRIGCLVSCGSDGGGFSFEMNALAEHMATMTALFRDYYKVEKISYRLLCRSGYADPVDLARRISGHVNSLMPDTAISIVEHPEQTINYYRGIQYKIDIGVNGQQVEIGDGGLVDWTQQMLQNKKERMLSSGIGFDLMRRLLKGEL